MHFSRIELNRAAVGVRELVRLVSGDGYQIHRRIWSIFTDGPERRRDFLYRHEATEGWPKFFAVSERLPSDSSGLWSILSKPYRPQLTKGEKLRFSLRANPVRTKRDADDRQHRHDVVMEAKMRLAREGGEGTRVNLPEIVQDAGTAWLRSRAERHGFAIAPAQLRVDGYQQHVLHRKQGRISFSTLDFHGILTVVEPTLFAQTLFHGIGPAKGFGCGLMLVKRII